MFIMKPTCNELAAAHCPKIKKILFYFICLKRIWQKFFIPVKFGAAGADGRTDNSRDMVRSCAKPPDHYPDSLPQNVPYSSTPAVMHRGHDTSYRVGQQHGLTVRVLHQQPNPRLVCDHGITHADGFSRVISGCNNQDRIRMDLLHGDKRYATKVLQQQPAVAPDIFSAIADSVGHIQRVPRHRTHSAPATVKAVDHTAVVKKSG